MCLLPVGQMGSLKDHYHFHHSRTPWLDSVVLCALTYHCGHFIVIFRCSGLRTREKRSVQSDPNFNFNDPSWSSMWYIVSAYPCRSDMNILGAWQRGFTGKNVVVTILDDLAPNYARLCDHLASYDVNDNDPTPPYDFRNENIHGTRCAGEVAAAANNSHCIAGVAFNAHIGGSHLFLLYLCMLLMKLTNTFLKQNAAETLWLSHIFSCYFSSEGSPHLFSLFIPVNSIVILLNK
uniref:Peptidase S8/S53 domain-containing protein n=1 Tax=Neogobius melanostomus TaxID=47308 RepID=A0A8C6UDT8_9GOBI